MVSKIVNSNRWEDTTFWNLYLFDFGVPVTYFSGSFSISARPEVLISYRFFHEGCPKIVSFSVPFFTGVRACFGNLVGPRNGVPRHQKLDPKMERHLKVSGPTSGPKMEQISGVTGTTVQANMAKMAPHSPKITQDGLKMTQHGPRCS